MPETPTTTVHGRDIAAGDRVHVNGRWELVRGVLGGDMFCDVLTEGGRICVKPGLTYQIKRSQDQG